ncbi:MAG: hypothetical protein ACRDRE_01695 [Pseudonocardiaceae bacterium]
MEKNIRQSYVVVVNVQLITGGEIDEKSQMAMSAACAYLLCRMAILDSVVTLGAAW